jgi:zinc-ribbon domain/Sel1 repeat
LRCSRCGNENSEQNRFCGMCGASLLATPPAKPAEPQPVSVAAAPTATRVVAEPAQEPPRSVAEGSTSISGPSFLGLNDPAPGRGAPRKRASLSIDPHSAPGSNLDYLLAEEEPTHHWGIGKILLLLIAFGLAAGFGYLRFKNQGLAWLNPSTKPSAAAQNSTAPDTTTLPPSSPSSTPESQPSAQPSAAAPPQPQPQPTTAAPSNPPSSNPAATPAQAAPAPTTPAPSDTAKPSDAPADATSEKAAAPADPEKAASPSDAGDKDSSPPKETSPDNPPAATKPVEKPKPAPKAPPPKPSAASRPVAAYDAVAEAQKYLYGRGAPQDCDRGLRLLRPAANQAQPKAMIEMGALYSAGLCTPHDLPTAYRWFAMALRKDPENTAVQADLQKLWGEMTQPERQLAIKLTQ